MGLGKMAWVSHNLTRDHGFESISINFLFKYNFINLMYYIRTLISIVGLMIQILSPAIVTKSFNYYLLVFFVKKH